MPETSPILCTIAGLALFISYFSYILIRVPRHWGVPHKKRLSAYLEDGSAHGYAVEIINAVFSILSGAIFVMETYSWSASHDFVVSAFSLELFFNGFFVCNYVLCLYLARDKRWYLVSFQAIVDVVTIVPSYAVLPLEDDWQASRGLFYRVYKGLKVTRIIRVARLLRAITYFSGGPAVAFDRSRQLLALRAQLIRHGLQTAVAIFVLAGVVNFLVEVQAADWGSGDDRMPFHDALYYIVVSLSTVGYGDLSPSTALSRLLITALILSIFICAPLITNSVINVMRLTPTHGGRLHKSLGTGHIVLGCDSSCLRVVSVLLRELLAPESMALHTTHVVVMVPQEPTLAWQALLCLQPQQAVTYLNGDLSSAEDLRRARVDHALACFVLSDRLARDTTEQDKAALVRALCVHQVSPPGSPVLCLVTHRESKLQLVRLGLPASGVVCYDDVMEILVASACLHPGFSTLWANTLSSMTEATHLLRAKGAQNEASRGLGAAAVFDTEIEYLRSLHRVLIRFHLGPAFSAERVGDVAMELYRECQCTLFALVTASASTTVVGDSRSAYDRASTAKLTGKQEGGGKSGEMSRRSRRRTRVHPAYATLVRKDDVGVFIGDDHKAADCLARYCANRVPPETAQEQLANVVEKPSSTPCTPASPYTPSRNQQNLGNREAELNLPQCNNGSRVAREGGGDGDGGDRGGHSTEVLACRQSLAISQAKGQEGPPIVCNSIPETAADSSGVDDAGGAKQGRWAEVQRGGDAGEPARLSPPALQKGGNPPPVVGIPASMVVGRVLVIAQSLADSVGVVNALCDACSRSDEDIPRSGRRSSESGRSKNDRLACAPSPGSYLTSEVILSSSTDRRQGGGGETVGMSAASASAGLMVAGGNDHRSAGAVTVLCPAGSSWDPVGDELAARELFARRRPSVRVHNSVMGRRGLLECGAEQANLVCIVSSRGPNQPQQGHVHHDADGIEAGFGGLGNRGGGRQGSDGWAVSAVVDVLCVVPESTRVVVRFDDAASVEQHQVINAHVRCGGKRLSLSRTGSSLEDQEEERELHVWDDDDDGDASLREEENEGELSGDCNGISGITSRQHEGLAPPESSRRAPPPSRKVALLSEQNVSDGDGHCDPSAVYRGERADPTEGEVRVEGGVERGEVDEESEAGGYFDDVRGGQHPGFEGFYATTSGYASGDVVVGSAAELLLLQAMVADDIQSLFNGVLDLVCRVPIDALWPQRGTSGGQSRSSAENGGECRPATYGEAYQSLLQDYDLLPLGLHRAPISGGSSCSNIGYSSAGWTGPDQSTIRSDGQCKVRPMDEFDNGCRAAAGYGKEREDEERRKFRGEERGSSNPCNCCCPSGSQFLAIACPSPSFLLRDGDCVFVLRHGGQGRRGRRLRQTLRPREIASQGVAAKMTPIVATTSATGVTDDRKEMAAAIRSGLPSDKDMTTTNSVREPELSSIRDET